jgi:hypothetical protein
MKLLSFLRIYPLLKEISAKIILRQNVNNIFGVRFGLSNNTAIDFLFFILSPKKNLNHPIECLRFNKIERNILAMPLYNSRCVEDSNVVQFFGINPHNFKSLRFLTKAFNPRKRSLYFISVRQHFLDKNIIFFDLSFLDMFGL